MIGIQRDEYRWIRAALSVLSGVVLIASNETVAARAPTSPT
jgi:hypothetical protein